MKQVILAKPGSAYGGVCGNDGREMNNSKKQMEFRIRSNRRIELHRITFF